MRSFEVKAIPIRGVAEEGRGRHHKWSRGHLSNGVVGARLEIGIVDISANHWCRESGIGCLEAHLLELMSGENDGEGGCSGGLVGGVGEGGVRRAPFTTLSAVNASCASTEDKFELRISRSERAQGEAATKEENEPRQRRRHARQF